MVATLRLKDGFELNGKLVGAPLKVVRGNLISSYSIPGYEAALQDPANKGAIISFISPMVGSYGISFSDIESSGPMAAAFLLKKLYRGPVLPGRITLEKFMLEKGISALENIDTRALNIHLSKNGEMSAVIFTEEYRKEALELLEKEEERELSSLYENETEINGKGGRRLSLLDLGASRGLVRMLCKHGYDLKIFTRDSKAEDILSYSDTLLVSNGSGCPKKEEKATALLSSLNGKVRLCGLGLGALLLNRISGGEVEHMKKGIHGSLAIRRKDGSIFMSAKNTAGSIKSLPEGFETTHVEPNTNRIEGFRNQDGRISGLMFAAEGNPGPEESQKELFDMLEGDN